MSHWEEIYLGCDSPGFQNESTSLMTGGWKTFALGSGRSKHVTVTRFSNEAPETVLL